MEQDAALYSQSSYPFNLPQFMRFSAPRVYPLRVLAALTVAVLAVHLALLQATPLSLSLNQPEPVRAFTTRAIELAPPQQSRAKALPTPKPAALRKINADVPARATVAVVRSSAPESPSPQAGFREEPTPPLPALATPTETSPPPEILSDELAVVTDSRPPRPARETAPAVSADALPGSVRLKYEVDANKFPFRASAEFLWQQNGETYDARLELSVFGQRRVQTSNGQITKGGLAPSRFSDKYRSEVAAHFDREKGRVTFSANTPDAPLLAGAQDRLSILIQLAAMFAWHPDDYPPATTITVQTIGPRDADTWLFTVGDMETLDLPGGQKSALKLVRNPRQEFDQKVELWLAPSLSYLPARIRITEANGDSIDQKWIASEHPH